MEESTIGVGDSTFADLEPGADATTSKISRVDAARSDSQNGRSGAAFEVH
jgi:hypothetical protein